MALLDVKDAKISIGPVSPLDGVSFALERGEILGLVGESGSGKSLTAMAVMGLLPLIGGRVSSGSIRFDGMELTELDEARYRALRGKRIAFISQNPMTALDPLQTIGAQIDVIGTLHFGKSAAEARSRTVEVLTQLRIPDAAAICASYPHQLSGGMKQRIVIAMALAGEPDLIIADEPTTALDVTVQAQIIHLLASLVRERGMALLLITHDMGVVAQCCDKVAVLYAGRLAEAASIDALFAAPAHPYTQALIACIPRAETVKGTLSGIPGAVPAVSAYPSGCRYHPRCGRAQAVCTGTVPSIADRDGGVVACHFPAAAGVRTHG